MSHVTVILLGFLLYACIGNHYISIKGTVTNIQQGKDGYTALITTKEGQQYHAVVSMVDLAYSLDYEDVKVGDFVTVTGDTLNLGDRISMNVKAIRR